MMDKKNMVVSNKEMEMTRKGNQGKGDECLQTN